ncbi:dihydroorotase [Membranihabitans maritimus]|uniref:dihydroorotase n=1 Tax=Membranihabitans maritimus TaxID=2904244 RepID=UPI001F218778|nr:dihydroorotase [Membranihabitans maritimus]
MRILFKNVELCFPGSGLHGQKTDIYLEYGTVKEIGQGIKEVPRTKILQGGVLAPGFVDLGAFTGEPGFEHKETLRTFSRSARMGGYTHVFVLPNVDPVTDDRSAANYLKDDTGSISIQPLGAITRDINGEELADIYDMHSSGVRAFTDGFCPIQSIGMMKRALEYVKAFDGVVMNQPYEHSLEPEGKIHESEISTEMGLKGIPVLAETTMLKRDIDLLEYTGSKLISHGISSEQSVVLIQKARKKGIQIFATAPFFNLVHNSKDLQTFNTNYLVNPPLRGEEDRKALLKGLKEGVLDCIVSGHLPVEDDYKKVEFGEAEMGISSLPFVFPVLYDRLHKSLSLDDLVRLLSIGPRKILGMEPVDIHQGSGVDFVWIDPSLKTQYNEKNYPGKSRNNPFLDKEWKGKILGVFRKDQYDLYE